MKYYTIQDSDGWFSTFLLKTIEAARAKINVLKFEKDWEEVTRFNILCIDTRVKRIDVIETIII